MRVRGRVFAGVVGCAALLTVTGLVTPAAGFNRTGGGGQAVSLSRADCGAEAPCERGGGGRMPAGDIAADCEEASMNTPRGGGDGIELTADVADGTTVAPGDTITLRLTWDSTRWSRPDLDRALACVRVKGILDPKLSGQEGPTANDGLFEYRLHIPDNIKPNCDVCVEGFLSGLTADGQPRQQRSNRHCFMSGPPGPPTPPATDPPTPPATEPPAPPDTAPPDTAPPDPAATTTATEPVRLPAEVGGIAASNPTSPAPGQPGTEVGSGELPRTGAAGQVGAAGGGLFLALGGLAVIGGTARRRRAP